MMRRGCREAACPLDEGGPCGAITVATAGMLRCGGDVRPVRRSPAQRRKCFETPDPLNETDRARRMYHRRSSSRFGLGFARYQVFLYPSSTHTARGGGPAACQP